MTSNRRCVCKHRNISSYVVNVFKQMSSRYVFILTIFLDIQMRISKMSFFSIQYPRHGFGRMVLVRYGMYFRRISLLKLIFLLLWVQFGSDYQKMKGFKFSSPSFLFGRVISVLAPQSRLCTYFLHLVTNLNKVKVVL